jgi:hypothetical protein
MPKPQGRWTVHLKTTDGEHFEHKHEFPSQKAAEVFVDAYIKPEPEWLAELRIYPPGSRGPDDYAKRLLFNKGVRIDERDDQRN